MSEAEKLADLGAYADATSLLNDASASLDLNTATANTIADLQAAKADVLYTEAMTLADAGEYKQAEKRQLITLQPEVKLPKRHPLVTSSIRQSAILMRLISIQLARSMYPVTRLFAIC